MFSSQYVAETYCHNMLWLSKVYMDSKKQLYYTYNYVYYTYNYGRKSHKAVRKYSSCIKALLSYESLNGEKVSCKNQSPSDFSGLYTFL